MLRPKLLNNCHGFNIGNQSTYMPQASIFELWISALMRKDKKNFS